jgi:hypothetical protein
VKTYICPTTPGPRNSTILGCGATFHAEPDHEGLVDCPNCEIWFPAKEVVLTTTSQSLTKEAASALAAVGVTLVVTRTDVRLCSQADHDEGEWDDGLSDTCGRCGHPGTIPVLTRRSARQLA